MRIYYNLAQDQTYRKQTSTINPQPYIVMQGHLFCDHTCIRNSRVITPCTIYSRLMGDDGWLTVTHPSRSPCGDMPLTMKSKKQLANSHDLRKFLENVKNKTAVKFSSVLYALHFELVLTCSSCRPELFRRRSLEICLIVFVWEFELVVLIVFNHLQRNYWIPSQ